MRWAKKRGFPITKLHFSDLSMKKIRVGSTNRNATGQKLQVHGAFFKCDRGFAVANGVAPQYTVTGGGLLLPNGEKNLNKKNLPVMTKQTRTVKVA